MEIYELKLSRAELILIDGLNILQKLNVKEKLNKTYILLINNSEAVILSDKLQQLLLSEGFNRNYDINDKGRMYEALMDRIYDIRS